MPDGRVVVDGGLCVRLCFREKRMQSALAVCWVQGLKERLLSSWDWSEDVVSEGPLRAAHSCQSN